MTHLTKPVQDTIGKQARLGGIDVSRLKPGTVVEFVTQNSTYRVKILDDGFVEVQGGKHFEVPTRASLTGSTWGTSLVKTEWIGQMMNVEFVYWPAGSPFKVITTSCVRDATVFLPNGVIYPLEWAAPDDTA